MTDDELKKEMVKLLPEGEQREKFAMEMHILELVGQKKEPVDIIEACFSVICSISLKLKIPLGPLKDSLTNTYESKRRVNVNMPADPRAAIEDIVRNLNN